MEHPMFHCKDISRTGRKTKGLCGLGRRYLEDYISAVRPLRGAAVNAEETELKTIIFMNRNTLCIRFFYMNCTVSVNTTTIAAEIPKMGGGIAMKATGIVRRIDDLGRVVIPKEIRRTLRIREGDPLQMTLASWEKFCFAVSDLAKRNGWS
jgi:AbrB family looped-hinge helix DNA binding protein